ncbi:MAG: hypothetical protein GC192_02180 [Bacteroidetes bacterium]|nr:hypothetical protein [Bacteroidota bacterium]
MTLPNFIIVGAQKAGTGSLYDILSKHPQVYMSFKKEINFFSFEKNYKKGIKYYSTFFRAVTNEQNLVGEASPGYMCFPNVAKKIFDTLGQIKIIMILRDPIKRAYSQYWDNRRHLTEPLKEHEILDKYLCAEFGKVSKGYFSRGAYINYINEFERYFLKENIHIIVLEELIASPEIELRKLYGFLNINPDNGLLTLPEAKNASMIWNNPLYLHLFNNPITSKFIPKRLKRFLHFGEKIKYKYKLPSNSQLDKLKSFYKPFNLLLEERIGKKLTYWL